MYKRIFSILIVMVFLMFSVSAVFAESDAVQDTGGESTSRIINVKVIWNDDGQTNNRPDSVTVRLLNNGSVVDSVILNESNFWNGTFKILDNGNYDVEETGDLSSYSISLTGDMDNGFVITNTIKQAPNNGSDDMIVDENSTDNSSDDVNGIIDDSNHTVDQNDAKDENQTENISQAKNTTYNNNDKEKQVIKKENKSVKKNNTNITGIKLKNTGLPVVVLVVVLFIIVITPISRWKK
ncbi:MAG: Cna B-type domain-containing protein [archaeon]|uniref:Cna B-type protein n=1 Tax=Methanobrevibacter gottschalkii DSM 11977 TaxID=1122229 RepID=A0A3N5C3Q8_9EURY|nr:MULTISPECIES: Cna B-type domain-containing protein [Methanobrevibacter]MCQ2970448.1 Cna B-type domain-containing protein [archaeon]OEC95141.1 hypothetical protein A9505_08060 [Methanobrevibacter sp. A27]RPF50931.1 Cna B-type protein [Methanobrevibacter gottschalkii DSM 11977]